MSEDTDLFAYGCNKIMKSVNIYNGNFIMYNIDSILHFYNMDNEEFKTVCTLSSNDYSSLNKKHFIHYFNLFKRYEADEISMNNNKFKSHDNTFMEWLTNMSYINNTDIAEYKKNKDMYNLKTKNIMSNYKYIMIRNKPYDRNKINILKIDRKMYLSGEKK